MSHAHQIEFFQHAQESFPKFFSGARVLEVGSLDINGSIRTLFPGCEYVGIDVGMGPGVDIAVAGEDYDAPSGSFDVVASAECMEHNPAWQETTRNMLRMLRPGGLFVMTCAAPGRREHGTTRMTPDASPLTVALGQEYYQNLSHRDFREAGVLVPLGVHGHWMNWPVRDLYVAGFKGDHDHHAWNQFAFAVDGWLAEIHDSSPIPSEERIALSTLGAHFYEAHLSAIRLPRRILNRGQRDLARLRVAARDARSD